jgi:hypothetical protein
MRHVKTLHLYRYWAALKGTRPAPRLSEFAPVILRSLMADVFTLRGTPLAFGYAGSRLRAALCRPVDGAAFEQLWQDADRADIQRLLAAVAGDRMPVILRLRLDWRHHSPIEAETLLVPALDSARSPAIIGSMALLDTTMACPAVAPALALVSASFPSRSLALPARAPDAAAPLSSGRSWPLRLVANTGRAG